MHDSSWMWMPTQDPSFAHFFAWHPQPIPLSLLVGVLGLLLYGYGLVQCHRRGIKWPVSRTISFAFGIVTIFLMCGTAFNGYGMAMFSVHMVQHMVLSMFTPVFWLAGRPITLAMRALPASSTLRHFHVWLTRSRLMWVLSSPPFALAFFIFSMYGLYFTPFFDDLMANWFGHEMMLVYFIVAGLLLYWPILGLDPSPHTLSRPVAFVTSIVPTPFHSFFAVTVMQANSLMVKTFSHPMPMWQLDPVKDQQLGGGLAWAFADLPGFVLVGVIAVQWWRANQREATRHDRSEERSGDAELEAYNRMLEQMNTDADRRL